MNVLARPARTPAGVAGWGRRRLLAAAVGVLLTATALLAGLGYAIYLSLAPSPHPTAPAAAASREGPGRPSSAQALVDVRRDGIAAAPMLAVSPQDALPAPPSTLTVPGILIPSASSSGAAGVPTGYPNTPEGAVGQLAAIETTVFQAMSMPLTAEVHRHWTVPDRSDPDTRADAPNGAGVGEAGVIELDLDERAGFDPQVAGGLADWEIARHVQSFLGTAQMGPEKDLTATVTATPAAGLIKGSDGPDWVLACVLLDVRAVITTEARIGYGHCERMQWHDGRWRIAPGAPPARAPSTWPGSQASIDAGWRTWVDADPAPNTSGTAGEG